jgi:iron(III) transport system substrate-binding protein
MLTLMLTAAVLVAGPGPARVAAQPADIDALQRSLVGLSPAAREQRLLEGAKGEGGQIVAYLTWNERQSHDLADQFQKRYPSVRVSVLRAGSGEIVNRMLTEGRAGRPTWDVGEIDHGFYASVKGAGLVGRYTSFARNGISQRFLDPQGWWVGAIVDPIALTWNTDKVPSGKGPRSYEDLAKPEWRGNFSLDTEDYDFFEYILETRGKEKGMALMRALAANKPRMVRGRTPQAQLLLAGEFAASAALLDYRVIDSKEKGAPIDYTYVEPVFVGVDPVILARSAVHPHGAILFLDWLISRAGQQVIADEGRTPVRADVKVKSEALKRPFSLKLFVRTANDSGADQNALIGQFNQLFGLSTGK